MLFEEAYEKFKIYAQKRHKKQGFITLQSDFSSNILPYFIGKDIYELKSIDILSWQNNILDRNYKYSFECKLYIEFNQFMNFCCSYLDLSENLVKKVGNFPKKIEEKSFDFYNIDEFNLFISNVDDPIYKQFFNLMFFTGTRPGEALALRFSDLHDNYLYIRHNLTSKGGKFLDSPKNQSSIRNILIDSQLRNDLLLLKEYYESKYHLACYDYYVFGGINPLSLSTINRRKKSACLKSGIRSITLHQFRHSHATLLLQSGIMINEVSRRLGHSKVSTTLDIYTHSDFEQEKRVLNTLDSLRNNFYNSSK